MNWVVVVPAWGERCVAHFVERALPAIEAAMARTASRFRFVVHTDQKARISAALGGYSFDLLAPLPGKNFHTVMGLCSRQGIAAAAIGEAVALINADMVGSVEMFAAAEARFASGVRLVQSIGTRTDEAACATMPIGANSRDLLGWAWANRQQWIRDCTWGEGDTRTPSVLYFQRGGDIVLRAFHLHPFALIKERELTFAGVTIDVDLAEQFPREQIHIVTDADELSFAEMSPADRAFGHVPDGLTVDAVARWARHSTSATHRWQFAHRIAIAGDPGADIGDGEICRQILARLH